MSVVVALSSLVIRVNGCLLLVNYLQVFGGPAHYIRGSVCSGHLSEDLGLGAR